MKKIVLLSAAFIASAIVISCNKNLLHPALQEAKLDLPATTQDYDGIKNDDQATLGRVLFYDRQLSVNNSISCGSCHKQAYAFADNTQFSRGFANAQTSRNTPGIVNASKKHNFFWDSRSHDLREMVLKPISNHIEMGFYDMSALPGKLSTVSYYPALFQKAYGSPEINEQRISDALANFVASINSENTVFDQHNKVMANTNLVNQFAINVAPPNTPLNTLQLEGLSLFTGKYNCVSCHNMNLTPNPSGGGGSGSGYAEGPTQPVVNNFQFPFNEGDQFINIQALAAENRLSVTNREKFVATEANTRISTANIGIDGSNGDVGLGAITNNPADNGRVRIPDLRNVALTAPYMHDGRFKTLDDVLNHYSHGIADNNNVDSRLRDAYGNPVVLNISSHDKMALKAFLETLTDENLVHDKKFADPFVY